jgi:hypothetical protein
VALEAPVQQARAELDVRDGVAQHMRGSAGRHEALVLYSTGQGRHVQGRAGHAASRRSRSASVMGCPKRSRQARRRSA